MKESVALAKDADAKKDFSSVRSDKSIHRIRDEPEKQLGSLRTVIGNIRHDGGTPSLDSIATELSSMRTAQRASVLLALQRTHGNRYVQRVVTGIQAKLKVGQPGDKYEQEADRVAEQVMLMPEPKVQRQANEEKEKLSIQPKTIVPIPALTLRRQEDEEEEELKKKKKEEEEEYILMAKGFSGKTPEVNDDLQARLNQFRSGGQPLPESVQAFFEPRFGHDFSQVRVHTDAQAAESAHVLNARAFTVGWDMVFGSRQYAPETAEGKQLLAHELTHVVQQTSSRGIAKPIRNIIQRAVTYDDCTPTQKGIILTSHNRAMAMVDTAIKKLGGYTGTTPADVRAALNRHFHSTHRTIASIVASNLIKVKANATSPQYECESVQIGRRRGWAMWCVPFSDIELYPLWFSDRNVDRRARTMIHEWFHRYACKFDLGYKGTPGYPSHGTLRSLLNADTFAYFVYDVR